jgi:6-phosphogluconolactonase/glucosamine-6-phosphate isomerase/deaminase
MTLCFTILLNASETILIARGTKKIKLLEKEEARKNLPIETLLSQNQNLTVLCTMG